MRTRILFAVSIALSAAVTAAGAEQRHFDQSGRAAAIERWTDHLLSELDHLQEDISFEREADLRRLGAPVDEALTAAVHFQRVLARGAGHAHLLRDFRALDTAVHNLLERLSSYRQSWLRRAASRIQYADQQLHYLLAATDAPGQDGYRELVARHAHVLETESRQLEQVARQERSRRQLDGSLERAVRSFADDAKHFHQSVERGADSEHLRNDFAELDRSWHRVVNQINTSPYGMYLRRHAQRVDAVHNQLHEILTGAGHGETGRREAIGDHPRESDRDRRRAPQIQFNIPGVGQFRLE